MADEKQYSCSKGLNEKVGRQWSVSGVYVAPSAIHIVGLFVDLNGKTVIEPTFEYAYRFKEGRALIARDGKFGFIDSTGKFICEPQFRMAGMFAEGLAPVQNKHRKWGFVDKQGRMSIPFKYDYVDGFSQGLAKIGARKSDL